MPDAGRVVTGTAKGVRLLAPGEGTRPLGDRVKQALFASLEAADPTPWSGSFLDLFAGSGAAGIEALSRGAPDAVFVERDAKACRVIERNLQRAGFGNDRARVEGVDVLRYLQRGAGDRVAATPFLTVMLDPPYGDAAMLPSLRLLGDPAHGWLGEGATVVAKHFWRDILPEQIGRLREDRSRRFGETMLTFYRMETAR